MFDALLSFFDRLQWLTIGGTALFAALTLYAGIGPLRAMSTRLRYLMAGLPMLVTGFSIGMLIDQDRVKDLRSRVEFRENELSGIREQADVLQAELLSRQKALGEVQKKVISYELLIENNPELRCHADDDFSDRLRDILGTVPINRTDSPATGPK